MKCFYFFRSKGILPYDHNRVELEEYIDADDYVNASWIGGDEKLIATQGPLPTTVVHFLQMIVEREVELIVMLGAHMEKDNKGIST
jgi:protein tyrosine phosphatase